MSLVELRSVGHYYDDPSRVILKPFSATIEEGQWIWLQGMNGCGKSTLLKIISGIMKPALGEIDSSVSLHRVGVLFSKSGVHPQWTVMETLRRWQEMLQTSDIELKRVSDLFEIDQVLNLSSSQLSAGWLRRLAMMRVFLRPRQLYVIDEAWNFLDQHMIKKVQHELRLKQGQGSAICMTSHESAFLAGSDEHYVWFIEGGTVSCSVLT